MLGFEVLPGWVGTSGGGTHPLGAANLSFPCRLYCVVLFLSNMHGH